MERQAQTTGPISDKRLNRLVRIITAIMFFVLLNFGCAPTTKVVVMPDQDGKVGVVEARTNWDRQTLNQAYQAIEYSKPDKPMDEPVILEEKEVQQTFGEALAALPAPPPPEPPPMEAIKEPAKAEAVLPEVIPPPEPVKPESFIVYFETNRFTLSQEALALLEKVVNAIRVHQAKDILISGHTDSVGSSTLNRQLSLKRAKAVENFLVNKGIDRQTIHSSYHGKDKLQVSTPDGVPEPRNRRVEVTVK